MNWMLVAKIALNIAIWAAGHPTIIKQIIDDIVQAEKDIMKASHE
jgi:hypothetical protein